MNNGSTVSAEVALRLVVPQQAMMPIKASLSYTREDPYAIRVAFHVGVDEPVEWIFARELLSAGADGAVGSGDVKVWPSADSQHGIAGDVLNIELSSPFGQAHFEAPAAEVSSFLSRTYELVPAGREGEQVDLDDELGRLLRQAS